MAPDRDEDPYFEKPRLAMSDTQFESLMRAVKFAIACALGGLVIWVDPSVVESATVVLVLFVIAWSL